jgi:hypothetical protein
MACNSKAPAVLRGRPNRPKSTSAAGPSVVANHRAREARRGARLLIKNRAADTVNPYRNPTHQQQAFLPRAGQKNTLFCAEL